MFQLNVGKLLLIVGLVHVLTISFLYTVHVQKIMKETDVRLKV